MMYDKCANPECRAEFEVINGKKWCSQSCRQAFLRKSRVRTKGYRAQSEDVNDLHDQITNLNKMNNTLKEIIKKHKEKIDKLEETVDKKDKENDKVRDELYDAYQEIDRLQKINKTLKMQPGTPHISSARLEDYFKRVVIHEHRKNLHSSATIDLVRELCARFSHDIPRLTLDSQ
jgi:chromosome segregation ATPase